MPALPVGKLPPQLLQRLLSAHVSDDPRVVVGPQVGEDAAVLDIGDRYLVATTDPITFATDELGWYALHVNANDLAVRGARPLWFLATVLLPEGGATEHGVERLFTELREACAELGVSLIGGHTEVTAGLPRPIVSGCMLGEVEKDRLVTTGGARPGDVLLLTKGVPLEGAAIIARERAAEAERRGVSADVVKRAREFLRNPGISVVPEARAACAAARVHAMHDPTEGGVATACWELAQAADVGLHVDRERIPVLPRGPRALRGLRPRPARHDRVGLAAARGGPGRRRERDRGVPRRRRGLRADRPRHGSLAGREPRDRGPRAPHAHVPPGSDHPHLLGGLGCPRSVTRIVRRPWAGAAWWPRATRSPRWPAWTC